MKWYIKVLKNFAVFTGRARRSEYWYFVLFNMLFSFGFGMMDVLVGTYDEVNEVGLISTIYTFAVLVPSIAVGVRRMHDVGKSGWFLLIPFYNLYLAVQDSVPGPNEYGPNPKSEEADILDHLVE